MPHLTVVVAVYNQGQYLEQCLNSLLSQSMPRDDYEVIVVDDGSTDETPDIINGYRSDIRTVRFSQNRGLAHACNAGLDHAHGQYVVRVDSDDWVDKDALLGLYRVIEQTGTDIVLPDYSRVVGSEHRRHSPRPDNVFTWLAGGSLMRKETVMAVGGYRFMFWEEYDLYLRLLVKGARVVRMPQVVLYYRANPESMTAREEARLTGWRELLHTWPAETLRCWGHDDELERVIGGKVVTP